MSRYALRRGIDTSYRASLFSKHLEKLQNVPRGTKHEVMDISPNNTIQEGRFVGKFRLKDK